MRNTGEVGNLLLERIDVRTERCDPVRLDGIPKQVELTAGQMRGGEIDAGHRGTSVTA